MLLYTITDFRFDIDIDNTNIFNRRCWQAYLLLLLVDVFGSVFIELILDMIDFIKINFEVKWFMLRSTDTDMDMDMKTHQIHKIT